MEAVSIFDETVAGVMAIGFVIAIYMKDGFVASCPGQTGAQTGQPQSIEFMGDFIGPSSGIPSVAEFQQASTNNGGIQPGIPMQPGTTLT